MPDGQVQTSGLARWRERQEQLKAARRAELAEYRKDATEVERDGRVYLLVRIPDRYDFKKGADDGVEG